MLYYLTVAGLIAHTFFWGAGLAWAVTPRRWRAWAWTLMPTCGLALQSAVVWAGAHTSLAGTNHYAWWSELLPLGLAVAAIGRGRVVRPRGLLSGKTAWLAAGAALLAGWLLLSPLAERGAWTLTTSSLGSNDQADYAAGARVLQEFSKDDRTGFLGLPEVTRVRSTDFFFDYFVRQNHFTPSALIAHHAAIFGLQPYQLVSAVGVAWLLLALPIALLLARTVAGLRGAWLAGFGAVLVVSPLNAYAVHHGALGQLLAMQGIALLTWAGVVAARAAGRSARAAWAYLPLLIIAVWVLAGSYNFILVIAAAPLGAGLVFEAWRRREARTALRVAMVLMAAVAVSAVLFAARFTGVVERFSLLEEYSFGWAVPLLTPEGWLGVVRDVELRAWPVAVRVAVVGVIGLAWIGAVAVAWRRQRRRCLALLALTLPVIAGWAVLTWESRVRANASYDAYKVLMVFFPGLLAGGLGGLAAGWARSVLGRVLLVALLGVNLLGAWRFHEAMRVPPLRVERSLLELAALENESRVTSVNMRIDDFWARLWANALLLRKAQYFPTHTYEARLNTTLRGEWDLRQGQIQPTPLRTEDLIRVNDFFRVTRAGAPGVIEGSFHTGWHAAEGRGLALWRWAAGDAQVLLDNPSSAPVAVELVARVRAASPRTLGLRVEQHEAAPVALTAGEQIAVFRDVLLQPGRTVATFHTNAPPVTPPGDGRALTFALYGLEIRAVSRESGQPVVSAHK